MALLAQTQTQKGYSFRYNGKNPRIPLSDVQIEYGNPKEAVKSDSTGTFWLVFNNMKMGDHIGLVTVKKREMMVFNQQAVDEWSIRKEPLCLILCDANEFEKQKQDLIEIGRREAKKKYDRQKAELERLLEANQIDRAKYEAKLDSAWQELDRLHKHIDEYADLFARIDESEIDSIAQRAMDLFNQGQVDKAVRLFEQGNYLEKLKASNRAIHQADLLIETVEQGKAKAERDRNEQLQSLKAQIAAYKMQNDWEKAGVLLKGLADELYTVDALYEYASFCNSQNHFDQAELYYQKMDSLLESIQSTKEEEDYFSKKSKLLSGFAYVYKATQRYNESEAVLLSAIDIYGHLMQKTPSFYDLKYAQTLNCLGDLYCDWNRFEECESNCFAALSTCEKYDGDCETEEYYYTKAEIYNILGKLYEKKQRFEESESMFLYAIDYFNHLVSVNPSTYQFSVCKSLMNIAGLYYITHRYDESETICLEALSIIEHAAKTNPDAYMLYHAMAQMQLADLYKTTQKIEKSEELYLSSIKTLEQLAENNPLVYLPYIAGVKQNISGLYEKTHRIKESEALDLEALHIIEHLAEINPTAYEPQVADIKLNLAISYVQEMRYSESENMFLSALNTYKELSQSNPTVYLPNLQIVYKNLGLFYFRLGQFDDSETMYQSSLEIAEMLASTNPSVYEPIVAEANLDLGSMYEYSQRFEESETMVLAAKQIYERLSLSYPLVYEPSLAETYHTLAVLYYYTQQYDKSADFYTLELNIFERLAETNPAKFEYNVATVLYAIGLLRLVQEQYSEGIEALDRAILIYKRLLPMNPSIQQNYYGATHWIAHLYEGIKDYSSAYNALNGWLSWAKESQWNVPEFSIKELENISKYAILDEKFAEAEQWALEGLKIDSTQHSFFSNLAASMLFQGKYEEAEQIYRQYKNELNDTFQQDLNDFEAAGIIPEERKADVERIRKILTE